MFPLSKVFFWGEILSNSFDLVKTTVVPKWGAESRLNYHDGFEFDDLKHP